jgi:hypothetical protein
MRTRYILITASTILVSLLLLQCNNYEFPESPYPGIVSLPVSNINEEGATFNAEIKSLAGKTLINHGFVWGTDKDLSLNNDEKIVLGKKEQAGIFSADIRYGLLKGKIYYVRPFGTTEEGITIYGLITSFTSKSSSQPVTNGIIPNIGYWGDTLILKGSNFSTSTKNIKVLFGDKLANVLMATDTTIRCTVPENLFPKKTLVSMESNGIKAAITLEFTMLTPLITGFSPERAALGETVIISGKNFHPLIHRNNVSIGDISASVIQATENELRIVVPNDKNLKPSHIKVTTCGQTTISEKQLVVNPPVIKSISTKAAKTGSTIFIYGDNFNETPEGNLVYFDGNKADVWNSSRNILEVEIPVGPYKNRSFRIEVVVAGQSIFSNEFITIMDTWLRKPDCPIPAHGSTSFTIDNTGYVGLGSGNAFYKFNPLSNNWTNAPSLPVQGRYKAAGFVIDNRAYVGLGTVNNVPQQDFYKFDPSTERWAKIKDFPQKTNFAIGFATRGKGYLIIESEGMKFWEYDPEKNEWSTLNNIPVEHPKYHIESGFLINDRIYVLYSDQYGYSNQFWQYDLATNSWNRKGDLKSLPSYTSYGTAGFTLNEKGYLAGSLWLHRYNPSNDTWDININRVPDIRKLPFSFVIQNKAYFGGGLEYTNPNYSFWEYDPEYEDNK